MTAGKAKRCLLDGDFDGGGAMEGFGGRNMTMDSMSA